MPALDNEKIIYNQIVQKYNPNIEKSKPVVVINDLKVNVDLIWKEKDLTLLLEIDSNNAVKMIFGEYVLLNQVKLYESNCILVIIHFYKKYNIERTIKYLEFAVHKLKCNLPYVVFSNTDWQELVKNKSKAELIKFLKKQQS
jgi:hypothetical protein